MIEKLYRLRFSNQKKRILIWQILVKDFFQQFIKPTDTVLDMPCGYCEFINAITCKKKIGVDLNQESKLRAGKAVRVYTRPSTKTGLPKESIDKVFISNFFEHVLRSDIEKTIQELKRILKIKGQVLILQPNIRFCSKDYWMFFDHITPIDDRALEEIFLSHGFKLKKRILRFLPYTTKSSLPIHIFLIRLYLRVPLLWYIFGKQSFLIFEK